MPSTAVLLLEGVARLRPGESVLMHSVGGGSGRRSRRSPRP